MVGVFRLWAKGMLVFGIITAVVVFWNQVFLPLWFAHVWLRMICAFGLVSIVAIVVGGMITYGGCVQAATADPNYDEFGFRIRDDGEEHF